jgi:uncharacterized membrane protein
MIKSTLISIMIVLVFIAIYMLDLFAILSANVTFYIAIFVVIAMFIIAGIILGNPLIKDKGDDENYE